MPWPHGRPETPEEAAQTANFIGVIALLVLVGFLGYGAYLKIQEWAKTAAQARLPEVVNQTDQHVGPWPVYEAVRGKYGEEFINWTDVASRLTPAQCESFRSMVLSMSRDKPPIENERIYIHRGGVSEGIDGWLRDFGQLPPRR
jgi:hypothetical protein